MCWDLHWLGNWGDGLTYARFQSVLRAQGASQSPTLGSGKGPGLDSGDLVTREWEEPSESEHISSWRGDLLVGFFFFFLSFSCLCCFKYPVVSSVTVQRWEELPSPSSLERDRGEAEARREGRDGHRTGRVRKSPLSSAGVSTLRPQPWSLDTLGSLYSVRVYM